LIGILDVVPVLPSADISRDIKWYTQKLGFTLVGGDNMYCVMKLDNIRIHLQWHADTVDDPLLGGSVIRIMVKNIIPVFDDFVAREVVPKDKLRMNTDWGTHEFGLYDLNNNAIFIVQVAV